MISKLTDGPRVNADLSRTGAIVSRGENRKKSLNAAPWSETWPAPQATLDLDFANDRGYVRGVGQGRSMDAVTFTRASVGRFVDQDGLLQEAANNTPRFDWASTAQRPQNLLRYTEEFDNAAWSYSALNAPQADAIDAPNGTSTAEKIVATAAFGNIIQFSLISGSIFTFSVYVKADSFDNVEIGLANSPAYTNGAASRFDLTTGTFVSNRTFGSGYTINSNSIENIGNSWYRVSVNIVLSSSFAPIAWIGLTNNAVNNSSIYIWGAQLEVGDTATPYIANGAYSATNTPLAANPTSNGLLIEEARTNRLLWNRDATDAAWVKTDITAAKDQTGIDGVANAASSLTATADNGTCIQTITLASGSRTGSVFLKRITGTGNVQVSLDGSTWSTVDLSDTEWRRIVLSGTVTNPTVGIRLAVSGDAVTMDYGQIEDGAFATSPILTTTASVTRAADLATMSGQNFFSWFRPDQGAVFFEAKAQLGGGRVVSISGGPNPRLVDVYRSLDPSSWGFFTNVANNNYSFVSLGDSCKAVISYGPSGVLSSSVGATSNKHTSTSPSSIGVRCNRMEVGSWNNGASLCGSIKRIAYFNVGLNEPQAQIVSTP
jgi:hypothetical protein